jgi:L-seryl-tRNA(Ser) seleniumtransferase
MIFVIILTAAVVSLSAVDISGEWEMTSEGRQGPRTQTITIEQDGEKITVTMEGRMGEMTGEGTIKGNEIEWTFVRETPRGEMKTVYTGTVDGDSMSGMMAMGDFGEREWTAKKK